MTARQLVQHGYIPSTCDAVAREEDWTVPRVDRVQGLVTMATRFPLATGEPRRTKGWRREWQSTGGGGGRGADGAGWIYPLLCLPVLFGLRPRTVPPRGVQLSWLSPSSPLSSSSPMLLHRRCWGCRCRRRRCLRIWQTDLSWPATIQRSHE